MTLRERKYKKSWEVIRLADYVDPAKKENIFISLKRYFFAIAKYINDNQSNLGYEQIRKIVWDQQVLPITLRTFDRVTMNASIESRSPFLDYRLVELSRKLKIETLIGKDKNKPLHRDLLKKYKMYYPLNISKKLGFGSDLDSFFSNSKNKDMILKNFRKLDNSKLFKKIVTNKNEINKFIKQINKDKINNNLYNKFERYLLISLFLQNKI